jgi:hypothetical protein
MAEMVAVFRFLIPIIAIVLASCGSPVAPSPDLEGGVVATFESSGVQFKVFVTNPTTIDQLIQISRGVNTGRFPAGPIRRGAGAGDHNAPFSWHLDPAETEMVEAAIEVCDGSPTYVEEHVDEFVDVVGRYCPWGARLARLEDYR